MWCVTKFPRVPTSGKDTGCGKFLDDKKKLNFFCYLGSPKFNVRNTHKILDIFLDQEFFCVWCTDFLWCWFEFCLVVRDISGGVSWRQLDIFWRKNVFSDDLIYFFIFVFWRVHPSLGQTQVGDIHDFLKDLGDFGTRKNRLLRFKKGFCRSMCEMEGEVVCDEVPSGPNYLERYRVWQVFRWQKKN